MKCNKCGTEIMFTSKYCFKCGSSLDDDVNTKDESSMSRFSASKDEKSIKNTPNKKEAESKSEDSANSVGINSFVLRYESYFLTSSISLMLAIMLVWAFSIAK